ncbi:MAG: MCP four helix bundle domain-containing protein [Acidobacteriia bacterium]|nr:MCP four helix bundle domain-containing protein [Terriglobia bacterium]
MKAPRSGEIADSPNIHGNIFRYAESRVLDRTDPLLSSRVALAFGFGSLLAIIALAGIDSLRVLQNFQRNDDRIRRQFLSQNRVLNEIRSDVYVSGTYVRDYLLEPEPERAETYRANLEQVRRAMDSALDSYSRQLAPQEVRQYTALRSELAEYWQILAPVFKWDTAERRNVGYGFLRDEVFPRRQSMLAIADQIASINEQQLNAANEEVVGLLAKFQTRLAVTLFAALALGAALAGFSIRRVLRSEDQARVRYEEASEARVKLKDLSARLVQAQETERRALSRELHDEVGQSLSAVLIELRNLSTGLESKPTGQSRHQVEIIKGLVEGTIRVVRNMALLLRPSMLDDLGLVPALKWQAREVSKRTSMEVSVAAELNSDDFPDEYKTCIYRVVQEALHNCAEHARARTVRIRMQQEDNRLALTIQDDGQGFDATHVRGLGLLGMQERVARLGGTCSVHSEPGTGTILAVELPMTSEGVRETDPHPVG